MRTALALLLVVLGGRWWLVERAGSDLPLWDQWWSDFGTIVLPLSEGALGLPTLTTAHNEHYLFFQRLTTMALMAISGRWEPREALMVSAMVRAFGLAAVFLVLTRHQSRFTRGLFLALLAALGALPIGTFNLLSGFQIVFFMVEPLIVISLALVFDARPTAERIAAAVSLLFLALLNMATPLITALGAMVVLGLRLVLKRGDVSRNLGAAVAMGGLVLFAFVITPRTVGLQAKSISEFAGVFSGLAAWPFPEVPALGLLAVAPPLLLLRRLIRDPTAPWSSWFVFSVAVTSWIQNAAIAFARARSGQTEFPQYIDGLWLGHLVGLLALAEALRPKPGESAARQTWACAVWGVWLFAGLVADCSLRGMPEIQGVRVAVAERQPAFASALQKGDLGGFEAETRDVNQMLLDKEYTFLDDPMGRFALPGRFYMLLADRRQREGLVRFLPAALVGAEPSRLSRGLQVMGRFAPAILTLGLILLVSSLLGGFKRWRSL